MHSPICWKDVLQHVQDRKWSGYLVWSIAVRNCRGVCVGNPNLLHPRGNRSEKRAGKQMQADVYNREQVRLHSSSGYLCCESTDRDLPGVWGEGPGGARCWGWVHLNCTGSSASPGNAGQEIRCTRSEYHCLLLTVTGARCQYVRGEYI